MEETEVTPDKKLQMADKRPCPGREVLDSFTFLIWEIFVMLKEMERSRMAMPPCQIIMALHGDQYW